MKPLSDKAIRKLWLPMYSPGKMAGPLHPHYGYGQKEAGRAIAREAERNIREQMMEWGEEDCPHAFKPKRSDNWMKRECSECWQELKKLSNPEK